MLNTYETQSMYSYTHNILDTTTYLIYIYTALQVGRLRVRFPMVSLEFFIDIILLAALWPWGWLSL